MPRINGFKFPPIGNMKKGSKSRAVIYVGEELKSEEVNLNLSYGDTRLFHCAVQLNIPSQGTLTVINVYYPSQPTDESNFSWITSLDYSKKWVVAGDFNVSNPLWDSKFPKTQKNCYDHPLVDAILDSPLDFINDGQFTRIGNKRERNTAIDLSLVSTSLLVNSSYSWMVHNDSLFSDHCPISFSLGNRAPVEKNDFDNAPRFNFKKADWANFENQINKKVEELKNQNLDLVEPDQLLQIITDNILCCAEQAIPKRSPRASYALSVPWWDEDCNNAVHKKRKALENFRNNLITQNQQLFFEASTKCMEVLTNAQTKHWENFLNEEVHNHSDLHKVWDKLKNFNGYRPNNENKLINEKGESVTCSLDKANLFLKTFAKVSQSTHQEEDQKINKQDKEKAFQEPIPNNNLPINKPITLNEIKTALLETTTAGKATGFNPINNQMLRNLPLSFLNIICLLFQKCWINGVYPDQWKHALVVPIHKMGKPQNLPSSYRPIALTSHLGKLYERVVKNRLVYFLEENNVIPNSQAGFRKNRSCIEHVVHLVEDVKKAWHNGKAVVATFFDISRAFDTVWHAGLLNKLGQIGLSGNIYAFIKDFLTDRKISVKVGSHTSNHEFLDMGVPQGSVIAPILFIIMLYDLTMHVKNKNLTLSLFADDLAFWIKTPWRRKVPQNWLRTYQNLIDSVSNYMTENGFSLSTEKTKYLVFSRNKNLRECIKLKLSGVNLERSNAIKFLGVTIHDQLYWTEHCQNLLLKAKRGVRLIKLIAKERFATPAILRHLTISLVRSQLMYGHEVYFTAPKTLLNKLQVVELRALKHIFGLNHGAVNELVYQESDLLPFIEHIRVETAISEARFLLRDTEVKNSIGVSQASNSHPSRIKIKEKKPRYFNHTTTIDSYTQVIWDNIKPRPVSEPSVSMIPPWGRLVANYIINYTQNLTKKDNPLLLPLVSKEYIHKHFRNHHKLYTDGSVMEDGSVGSAFVDTKNKTYDSFKLPNGVGIFTAELFAIYKACFSIILSHNTSNYLIVSDSKSVLTALAKGGTHNRHNLQQCILNLVHYIIKKGSEINFIWVPSHSDILGNTLADIAAKEGTHLNEDNIKQLNFTYNDYKSMIKAHAKQSRNNFLDNYCQQQNYTRHITTRPFMSSMPRRQQRLIRRLNIGRQRFKFEDIDCRCGAAATTSHIFEGCDYLKNLKHISDNVKFGLISCLDYKRPTQNHGTILMRDLAESILKDGIGHWF
jgi:ribonuclease HI